MTLANGALDQVRRAEVRHEPELKGCRWTLLKRPADWKRDQINTMYWLQRSGLKTARAWRLKEALRAHLTGIVEHFRSGLSNGHVEAMNAQIAVLKMKPHFDSSKRVAVQVLPAFAAYHERGLVAGRRGAWV